MRPDTRLVVHQSLRQSLEQLKALVSNVLFLGAPQIYVSLSRSEDLITINVAHADICEVATSFWKTKCFGTLKVLSMWGSAGLDLQKILGEQQGRREKFSAQEERVMHEYRLIQQNEASTFRRRKLVDNLFLFGETLCVFLPRHI